MPASARDVVQELQRLQADQIERKRDVRPSRVEGRATDGRTLLLDLAGECVQASGSGGYQGQIVGHLPTIQRREGTTGVPLLPVRDVVAQLDVLSFEPAVFPRGSTNLEVLVTGLGFTAMTAIDFLLPASETLHPGIELVYTNFIDSEHLQLAINVAADAALVVEALIAFDDARRYA